MSSEACDVELGQVAADGRRKVAVRVRRGHKQYGDASVLHNFNMTVQEGTIYALLGASGCGKTTLLSCLVGRQRLDSGHISVLGLTPGENNFGALRNRLGYMPQDVAVYNSFTIKETMIYFGWIFNMASKEVEEKLQFWTKLLNLPPSSTKVNNISWGQKRRLSLAVALLHDPALIIMDEPTVGVDPVLRSVIWEHLIHLSSSCNKTIIITTHYIEEARQAHKVGLLRNGSLLAEESPESLQQRYESDSLEDVFIRLSEIQEKQSCSQGFATTSCQDEINDTSETSDNDFLDEIYASNIYKAGRSRNCISAGRMSALLFKNCTSIWKDVWLVVYLFGQSLALPTLVYYAYVKFPEDLRLAAVSRDVNSTAVGGSGCGDWTPTRRCEFADLGCRFVGHLASPDFATEFYNDSQLAVEAVRRGRAWGTLYFGENYTAALTERTLQENLVGDDVVEQSIVDVRLDMSDFITSQYLKLHLFNKYTEFLSEVVKSCGFNPKLVHIPLKINEPVYGRRTPRNVDYFGAPYVLFIVFFLGVALSTPSIVAERKEGLLDRNIVAGVTTLEILLSHFLAQFIVVASQVMVLSIGLHVYDVECLGNPFLVWSLYLIVGASGLILGFAISAFAQSEFSATLLANGCVLPLAVLSGIVWPMEGMNEYLAAVSRWLPLTLPVRAVRSVTARARTLTHQDVYSGFAAAGVWCLLFALLCAASVRLNRL